jgi:type IX secretion system PorP/SprF family membrane protein
MRYTFFIVLNFFVFVSTYAQDSYSNNFQYNRLESNPAYGGSYGDGKFVFGLVGKSSFNPIRGPFKYGNLTLDYKPCNSSFSPGLGLLINDETQGDGFLRITKFSGNIGIPISLSKNSSLCFGIRTGIIIQNVDWNEFTFSDQLDPIRGITNTSFNQNNYFEHTQTMNFDGGINFSKEINKSNRFMIGIGIFNLIEPSVGMLNSYRLPMRYSFQLNYIGTSGKYQNVTYHFYGRYDMQNEFQCLAINHETFFDSRISIGGGIKIPFINKYGFKNNLLPSILFSFQLNPVCKIYSSIETNFSGVNLIGYSKTFEVGIILISSYQMCKIGDFKKLFKYDKDAEIKQINCPPFSGKGKIVVF